MDGDRNLGASRLYRLVAFFLGPLCIPERNDVVKKKISLFLLICILGSVVTINATIIRDTTAGIENLEWLEFEYTQNMSRNEVEANILNTTLYEGYRYATRQETSFLLDSYYKFDITDVDDGWSK